MIYIYALVDPRNFMIRYIGVTGKCAKIRLCEHIDSAKYGSNYHVHKWIRVLLRCGVQPMIHVLDVTIKEDASLVECAWIHYYRYELGIKLTNMTDGGEGNLTNRKTPHTLEWKINHSERMKGIDNPNYGKRGIDSAVYGIKRSEQTRKLMIDNHANFIGNNNPNSKLTSDKVAELKRRSEYCSYDIEQLRRIAIEYEISYRHLRKILQGISWKHVA